MKKFVIVALTGLAAAAGSATAQVTGSITSTTPNPLTYVLPLNGNAVGTVNTNVNIPGGGAGDVDVLFVTDTTGSMGSLIASVQTAFSSVASSLATALPSVNFEYGVTDYKDFEDGGVYGTNGYRIGSTFTSNIATAQAAINAWSASGGGDGPEQNIAALRNTANDWTGALGGRNSAQKLVVWSGDINGWENGAKGLPYPTLNATIAALQARGAKVYGLNPFGAGTGIDGVGAAAAPGGPADGRNQASAITSNTGGQLFNNVNFANTTAVTNALIAAITTGATTVGQITVTIEGALGPWSVAVIGSPQIGPFTGPTNVPGSFGLNIIAPGVIDSRIVSVVLRADGAFLDSVPLSLTTIPTPGALGLLGLAGLVAGRRRRA